MKRVLPVLDTIFVIAILISFYFLYTGIAPIVEGKVRVQMQDEDDIEWKITNSTVYADTYVNILNGGTYDITDISLNICIKENETGYTVYEFSDNIPRVMAGSLYHEPINISVNIDDLPKDLKDRLTGNYTNFTVRGEISAYSINGMGEIKVHYHNIFQWEPLIKAMDVYANNSTISYGSDSLTIYVPYHVSTSHLLSGFASADIVIYNGSKTLSSAHEDIPLGEDYNGTLNFKISKKDTYYLMTHSEVLPIHARVSKNRFELDYSTQYVWGAPFNGLYIGELNKTLNTAYLDYSFTNDYRRALDLSISIHVYDSSGQLVGQSDDHYIVQKGEHIMRRASVSATAYPSYAIVDVTENISGWTYQMRRDIS